ncbi:hypothetical protein F5Y03DRAFT_263122 [Xylaria venustula]|nr:hypothetical protein F5Y03DRAFT_263122 [Xylaria venustula]
MAAVTLSSRRFACNRCRDQKTRCLRQRLDPDRCDRCLRADTECLTTPGSTAGHQLAKPLRLAARKWKHPHPGPHLAPAVSYTGIGSLGAPPDSVDSTDWSQLWGGSPYNLGLGDGFDDMVISNEDYQFSCTDAATTTAGAHIVAPPRTTQQDAAGFLPDETWGARNPQNSSPDTYASESHVHRLSSINLSLVSQLSQIDQGPPKVTLDMLISGSDESDPSSTSPVEDMLSITRRFIEILEALSHESALATTPTSSESGSDSNSSEPRLGISSEHLCGNRSVDTTTLLLVLSCYVQVLRLYVILFAHIHQYLVKLTENGTATLCPLPNMGFGNFEIESGNLQATLFIQMVTSLFERLECLLGLPSDLRVTTRASDQGAICLGDDIQGL